MDLKDLKKGDVFGEISHYTLLGFDGTNYVCKHHGSGNTVKLSPKYVEDLLVSANTYTKEVKVGKEDTVWTQVKLDKARKNGEDVSNVRIGDLHTKGIRSIFEGIHSQLPFTVCFKKQDKAVSNKELTRLRAEQLENVLKEVKKAKRSKKSVTKAAEDAIKLVQENPIVTTIPGEERILTGYKLQYDSRDGKYQCMDMTINDKRFVNINTIEWLIYKGVKYVRR